VKRLPFYLSLLLLLTCAKEDSKTPNTPPSQITRQYTLTVSAGDGGSVSTAGGTFSQGTQVSITATPNTGYSFSGWSNGSTDNPLSVTLDSNTSVTANFELSQKYILELGSRDYNLPHHKTRISQYGYINPHKVMLDNGRDENIVAPDSGRAAFADWTGDGYEDIIIAVQDSYCWTCTGKKPELYVYNPDLGDFFYEPINFTSNQDEVLNRSGHKIIGDFDNDGDPDLLFGGYEDKFPDGGVDRVWILENNYALDGTFTPHEVTDIIPKNETSTVDIDGDGDLDIFVVLERDPQYSNRPVFYINQGDFQFTRDDSYFELIEDVQVNHDFYLPGELNSTIFEDINGDGYLDVLWNTPINFWPDGMPTHVIETLGRRNKILWGSEGKWGFDNHTIIPTIEGFNIIDGIIPWDYNGDGITELVVPRDNGTNWNNAHTLPKGHYVQILKIDKTTLIDVTVNVIENYTEVGITALKPTRFVDFDKDGLYSLIRPQKYFNLGGYRPGIDEPPIYEWEFNGTKIVRVR